jgi:hypothetical protein
MKKIIVLPLFLILTVANLYGKSSQNITNDNNDSLSTNHIIINKKSENEQKNKLKIPEGISKNNFDQVFGSCLNCVEIERLITKKDATELDNLPNMVKNTIDEITKYKKGRYDDFHNIITKLSKGDINTNFIPALRIGERICQVFYFSFMNNSVQLVGTHRCLVERLNDKPVVFKFTGNRLFATLKPYKESAMTFIGRSYIPEHQQQRYDIENPDNKENDNFGNQVGYAFSIDKKLVLLSISQRGFTEPDPTFFECLIIK